MILLSNTDFLLTGSAHFPRHSNRGEVSAIENRSTDGGVEIHREVSEGTNDEWRYKVMTR